MKNVLIYLNEGDLAPVGGENGYNYTLRDGLKEIYQDDFKFHYLRGKSVSNSINQKMKKTKSSLIKSVVTVAKSIIKKGLMLYGPVHRAKVNLNAYDVIHFHRTMDMYWAKDSLKDYTGKVILTLHTPTMPCKQTFESLTKFEKKYMKWFYKKLSLVDNYAIERADYVFIACPDAEEPYYHEWPGYGVFKQKNISKYCYMATGTAQKEVTVSSDKMREKYNIPNDAFVVAYVGRHNEIKGYDSLKEIGKELLSKNDNVYFFIGGVEGPLYHLEHDRWIEVGWTSEAGSLINSADVFVLPNKETYFDLVMLEVLSIGQIVVASYTGGNKYFEKFDNTGIYLYRSKEEAIKILHSIIEMPEIQRKMLRKNNRCLYKDEFTNEAFARRYIDSLKRII